MKYLKRISLAMALVMVMLALTACGGGSEAPVTTKNEDGTLSAEETRALNVYVCAQYVNADAAQELVDKLNESVEGLKDGTYKLEVTCVSTGSGEDPPRRTAALRCTAATRRASSGAARTACTGCMCWIRYTLKGRCAFR